MQKSLPVSVIIPCYHCRNTIQRALNSILNQELLPQEIILVDDCSRDGSLEELMKFGATYPNLVRLLKLEKNKGAASARNSGWAIATQPYIAFLDADDSWHPEKLSIQYEYMRNNPDVSLCGHQCIRLNDSETPPALPEYLLTTKIRAGSLLLKNAFSTPTVMLKRDIPFHFQDGKRFAEDLLLWQQIAFAGLGVVRIEMPLAYVHKPLYGANGLSAHLWAMEKGELSNFGTLFREGKIGGLLLTVSALFSIAKFGKRLLVKWTITTIQALQKVT